MISKKSIVFVTGSRADYGKQKSIILKLQNNNLFKINVFVTGMHNLKLYGNTWEELKKDKIKNIYRFNNQNNSEMDKILANTINGFSNYVNLIQPDLIVVHGDRVEPLACSIVGTLNNIKVAHIEGGELSGTVDEVIRHSISKLSNFHFVTNFIAKKRLIQLGEEKKNIFIIGSPDLDILLNKKLPDLSIVKKRYEIEFEKYSVLIFHPVTTESSKLNKNNTITLCRSLIKSNRNYVVILPNNDTHSDVIRSVYKKFFNRRKKFKLIPSMRFEFFLTLLKKADFIIGNSSCGVVEATYLGVPSINLGSRQNNRAKNINCIRKLTERIILYHIKNISNLKNRNKKNFGKGDSASKFVKILKSFQIWNLNTQKNFIDMN